VIDDGETWS